MILNIILKYDYAYLSFDYIIALSRISEILHIIDYIRNFEVFIKSLFYFCLCFSVNFLLFFFVLQQRKSCLRVSPKQSEPTVGGVGVWTLQRQPNPLKPPAAATNAKQKSPPPHQTLLPQQLTQGPALRLWFWLTNEMPPLPPFSTTLSYAVTKLSPAHVSAVFLFGCFSVKTQASYCIHA